MFPNSETKIAEFVCKQKKQNEKKEKFPFFAL